MRPRHWVALFAFVVVFGGLLGLGVKAIRDAAAARREIIASQQAELTCIAKWVNTFTARAELVNTADEARVRALDTLVHSLLKSTSRATQQAAVKAYLTASDTYQRQAAAHPLPPEPRFLCANLRGATPVPTPRVVTVTHTPPPVTRTHTTRVPAPTATRYVPRAATTVTVPGPVRTRIVTVTVPPGRRR